MGHLLARAVVVATLCAWPMVAMGQDTASPGFIRGVWVTFGAASVDPAPYWQRKWTTNFPHVGGDNHIDRVPELAGSIRLELNESKQLDISLTRWRVGLRSEWDSPGRTVHEIDRDVQEVRAFEANVVKRFGATRAGYIAGGGAAIVSTRRTLSFLKPVCDSIFQSCAPYEQRTNDTTLAGQGILGFEVNLTRRIRASVSYRMQVRDFHEFEIGGIYHGIAARLAVKIHEVH